MVLMALLISTFVTTPLVVAVYKAPEWRDEDTNTEVFQGRKLILNSECAQLACFHSTRYIPALMNLIEASLGTGTNRGLRAYAMHLMEPDQVRRGCGKQRGGTYGCYSNVTYHMVAVFLLLRDNYPGL